MISSGIEVSTAETVIELVKQVGFPIVVAGWVMFRTDKRMEDLTTAINSHFREGHK